MLVGSVVFRRLSGIHRSSLAPSPLCFRRTLTGRAAKTSRMSLGTAASAPQPTTTKRTSVGQTGPGHPASVGSFPSFSTVNFYAGNRLNRVSWLRQSSDFLNGVLVDDATRFVLLNHLNPLVHGRGEQQGALATLAWKDVRQAVLDSLDAETRQRMQEAGSPDKPVVFGPHVHGIAHKDGHTGLDAGAHDKVTQAVGPTSLAIVFLGMDETHLAQESMPGQMAQKESKEGGGDVDSGAQAAQAAGGVPLFALSLSYRPPNTPAGEKMPVERLADELEADGKYDFVDTRALAQAGTWPLHDAALVAQARSLIDWNERQQFCASCGRRQYSLWAGWKRACASSLGDDHVSAAFLQPLLSGASFAEDGRGTCLTTKTLSNFCYPRTDPTVIMAIVSPDGERILLGRQKKWPPGFYSCLAGFLEPGESLEEAVRREIYEESGVQVGKVTYHSSQPWPFPANLMMGAIGQAIEGRESIRLDLDNELEDARFFTRAEVLDVLAASSRMTLSRREVARMDDTLDRKRIEEEERRRAAAAKAGGAKWDEKDGGSVANVTQRRGSASSASSHDGPLRARPTFRIPGSTAIAHVLISAWARGEAHFPPDPFRGKM